MAKMKIKKKKKRKLTTKGKFVFGIGGLLLLIFLIWGAYRIYIVRSVANKEKEEYPITGIDVSKHTGYINWKKIKDQDIDFAYIKSTEGVTYIDSRFHYNFSQAKSVGIPVGVYHFFRFDRSGEEQARHFMEIVALDELDLPPVVDVEEWGQYNQSKDVDKVWAELRIFIDLVEEKSARKVFVYSDKHSYSKYIKGKFEDNEVWICSLGCPPQIDRKWAFWQYSHKGRLKGADGKVDMNRFYGNREAWEEFLME